MPIHHRAIFVSPLNPNDKFSQGQSLGYAVFGLLMLLAVTIPLGAQPSTLVVDSHLGGFVNTFEVEGSSLFAAQADVFKIFDLSQDPLVATAFFIFDGEPSALAVADGKAFLALDQSLEILDFESAGGVMRLAGFDAGAVIQDLAIEGDLALLALGTSGLAIVDLQDPMSPVLAGTFAGTIQGVAATDGEAFLATDTGLIVLDLTDPANPLQIGALPGPAQSKVLLSGDLAFLFGAFAQGLQIVDIVDSTAPSLAAELTDGASFFHLAVDGERLYAMQQGRLVALDLTDLLNIVEVGELDVPFASDLELGSVADQVVVSASGQLRQVDFTDPAAAAFVGQPESPPFPTDHVQLDGELLVSAEDGLWRYDISDSTAPILLEHQPAFPAARIRAAGDVIYTVDATGVLRALERGPDGVTTELDSLNLPIELSPLLSFEVDQSHAYLLGFARLQIIDLSNPSDLSSAGHLDLAIPGRDVALIPNTDLLALGLSDFSATGTLALIDISDPAVPAETGQVTFEGRPDAVTASDTGVHVLARDADFIGFHIHSVDISTPSSPAVLESVAGIGEPRDLLAITGDGLLAAFATGGDLTEAPTGEKGAQDGGSIRNFEGGPINQIASQNLPEPASLSTAPSGESPFTSLSGFKLDSSQEIFGSKGFYFLSLLLPQQPELTLGSLTSPSLDCPPDPGEEMPIAFFSLCTDLNSGWEITSIGMAGRGTGNEELDVEQAILKFPGGPSMATFTADDGSVLFDIGVTLGAAQCLPMELFYVLTPEGRECSQEHTKTFAVEASGADVVATALNNPPGIKKPFVPIRTADQEIACVENETKGIGFPQVQPAIDDDRTDPGDSIGVCPGVFDELVVVNKKDLTVHSKETADVTFLGVEAVIDCDGGNGGTGDRVSIVEDGVRLLDFTITGAQNGVVVSGKNAEVFANIIGGNAGDGVRTVGVDLNTEIKLNVIGEQQSALSDIPTKRRNGANGISLFPGAGDSVEGNFLLGNCQNGLIINGFILHPDLGDGSPNKVLGNVIEGNLLDGIHILNSSMNEIGSAAAADQNLIGGHGGDGIEIQGIASVGNKVLGNRIGTGRNGSANANLEHGIRVHNGAGKTEIGGDNGGDACTGPCNAIEASVKNGIQLGGETGALTSETKIHGNFIGVNAAGQPSEGPIVGNEVGIFSTRASRTFIGTLDGNLISGNRSHGMLMEKGNENLNPFRNDASIAQNLIGTTLDGSAVLMDGEEPLGNGGAGVLIRGQIVVQLEVNTISGNNQKDINPEGGAVVALDTDSGSERKDVILVGNFIGTDREGKEALGNGTAGIWMSRAHASAIDSNIISGNPKGIVYEETAAPPLSKRHELTLNTIGLDRDELKKVPNDLGVLLLDSSGIEIASNTISGNTGDGIKLQGSSSQVGPERNQIIGNAIGTLPIEPERDFGNGGVGIHLEFATGNFIGSNEFLQTEGNLIHFNEIGILFDSRSDENFVVANEIKDQKSHGIEIRASSENIIGNASEGFGNTISNNGKGENAGTADGVAVTGGDAALANRIRGNEMQGNPDQAIDLEDDGVTANDEDPQDEADDDDGANDKQNFPKLISATQNGNMLTLSGLLLSKPGDFTIQVYESRCPSGGGPPELLRFLTEFNLTVGENRLEFINEVVTLQSDTTLGDISMTATGVEGTSEVEPCVDLSSIFSDGFESGDPSAWTDFDGGLP